MKTIIKGACYFDRENKTVLKPHFTGGFYTVDCTEYITEGKLKERYDQSFIDENKDDCIEVEGATYYYAESSPFLVEDWELLSDISDIEYTEEDFDF